MSPQLLILNSKIRSQFLQRCTIVLQVTDTNNYSQRLLQSNFNYSEMMPPELKYLVRK